MRLALLVTVTFALLALPVQGASYSGRFLLGNPVVMTSGECDEWGSMRPAWCDQGYAPGTIMWKALPGEAGKPFTLSAAAPAVWIVSLCFHSNPFSPTLNEQVCHQIDNLSPPLGMGSSVSGFVPTWTTYASVEARYGADIAWTLDVS